MIAKKIGLSILVLAAMIPSAGFSQSWVPPIEMVDPGAAGVRVTEEGIIANYLPAKGKGKQPAILLLGGSEGGLGSGALQMAVELQLAGFNVLQLSYYRAPGQPVAFTRVPLETFDKGIAWLKRQSAVDKRRIAIVGASKGAEAALIMASRNKDVKAVVAGMPSAFMWAAFGWDGTDQPGASWSLSGKDVAFLPYGEFDPIVGTASIYVNGLKMAGEHGDSAIKIERSQAQVLLICGKADALWPSCPMADMLQTRNRDISILAYEDAGHAVFGPPLADDSKSLPLLGSLGGSPIGNNQARKDSWPRVIAFLRNSLKR